MKKERSIIYGIEKDSDFMLLIVMIATTLLTGHITRSEQSGAETFINEVPGEGIAYCNFYGDPECRCASFIDGISQGIKDPGNPHVCFLPNSGKYFYSNCLKETGIGRLFFHLDVKEFILGYSGKGKHAVLDLPYTSRTNGRRMMLDAMEKLRKAVAQHHGFIVMFYGTNANSRF